ncbi:MAG: protein translocase subunit SecD [Lactobacillaceae bacterium]|jgi:protein-export membrane protein SecD|nr:protein translocase subunit SecD [Lactobacillaceae bacterium]
MYNLSKLKVFFIISVCVAGILYAVPNFIKNNSFMPSWWHPVNLGLDLQGGSYLLLEVKTDDVIKERLSSIEDETRKALRENKIRFQKISSTADAISIKIDDYNVKSKAVNVLKKLDADNGIEVKELVDGSLELKYTEIALNELKIKIVNQSIEIVRRRIDELGTKEPVIQRQGSDRILVQLPGLENPEYVKVLLGKTAKMSFHLVDGTTTAAQARSGKNPNAKVVKGQDGATYVIDRRPAVTGEHLIDAQPSFGEDGEAVVSFKFDSMGGRKFGEVTKNNIGERLAVVLDNEVITAPAINSMITTNGQITGNFTMQSANELAMMLRAGALPAPLEVLEERTVGAGLGADSIKAGVLASLYGILFIVVFMVAAYGLFGAFTTVAIITNLFLLIAALGFIGATLTLPGIAGIILTIAMAVDANVLIFERMREEIKAGRSVRDGADVGFTEAWRTIVDSNLTTLIAGIVLFFFGTGPIRGFAVTLTIGIMTSIFTSVTVTRLIIATWIAKCKPTKLPI